MVLWTSSTRVTNLEAVASLLFMKTTAICKKSQIWSFLRATFFKDFPFILYPARIQLYHIEIQLFPCYIPALLLISFLVVQTLPLTETPFDFGTYAKILSKDIFCCQRVTQDTCDLWHIWSEWWGRHDLTKTRQRQRHLENTFKERSSRLVTFETFDQSVEGKDEDKEI